MNEYDVELIAVDPQHRPEAIAVYRVLALSKTEAGMAACRLLAAPGLWKVLNVKQRA
ncbi:hypothetical protein [Ralstonia sp. Ralssp135]|uniref:hypothetical protein n=1 Tax=Ralstonia sp. Ralssp135 TaxID=3243016 RepID=UPI0039B09B80